MNRRSAYNLGFQLVAAAFLAMTLADPVAWSQAASDQPTSAPEATKTESQAFSQNPKTHWKILHIMSYHSPWEWTDDQLRGFKEGFKGLDVEYHVFQMDTKRNSSEDWQQKVGREARGLIDAWKPDLVYTTDDNAQKYVARYYLESEIPFVFSGVNGDPKDYGLVGTRNHTGVVEQEHFVETVRLLKDMKAQNTCEQRATSHRHSH